MWRDWKQDLEGFRDYIIAAWGKVFRFLFIFSIGAFSYSLIDDYNIGDIPLAQLTLKQIFGRIFSIGIVILCVVWFFHFPQRENERDPDPYLAWGYGSFFLVGIGIFIYFTGSIILKKFF